MTSAGSSLPPLGTARPVPGAVGRAAGSGGRGGGGFSGTSVSSSLPRQNRLPPGAAGAPRHLLIFQAAWDPRGMGLKTRPFPPKEIPATCRATGRNRHSRICGEVLTSKSLSHWQTKVLICNLQFEKNLTRA